MVINEIQYFLENNSISLKNFPKMSKTLNLYSKRINSNLFYYFKDDNIIIEINKVFHHIKNYTININTKGYFALIQQNFISKENSKLLFIAKDKFGINGILIIDISIENSIVQHSFYKSIDFKIICICPIIIKKEKESKETEYILICGFDYIKWEETIKLFKINLKDNLDKTTIKWIKDISFGEYNLFNEKFEGFEKQISYITQSEKTGNIIISCLDGKIYLLTQPNIDYYLRNDDCKI